LCGPTGPRGAQGSRGAQGATGTQGYTGETGAQGFTGAQGAPGIVSDTGATGAQGFTGAQGATGPSLTVTGGTNITVTGTASTRIVNLQDPLTSQLNVGTQNITTTAANGDINIVTNGTGGVNITEAVAGANGAFRVTQSSAGGTANPIVNLTNTNANALAPTFDFYKNSATVQAGDALGTLSFYGKNDVGTKKEFARMEVVGNAITAGSEQGFISFSRLTGSGGAPASILGLLPDRIECNNNPVSGVGTLTAQQVVCPIMTATTSTYPKYDANTFEIKTDAVVSSIPNPTYEGETFVGVNGGRTPNSWFSQIANDIGFNASCVVEFAGFLFWAGDGAIRRTDYAGNVLTTYSVNKPSSAGVVNTLCDSGGNLYVGGDFTDIDSIPCNNLARIDNTGFSVFQYTDINGDNGLNAVVYSIRDETSGLGGFFACGAFTATGGAGSTTLHRIALSGGSGSAWQTYPQIDNGEVYDCARFSSGGAELILVGGSFTNYGGGNICADIVGYDITNITYFPVGSTGGYSDFNGKVFSFAKDNALRVYIAGDFTSIAGNPFSYSVYFDFSNLQSPQNYDFPSSLRCILWDATNGIMYRGGANFFAVDDTVFTSNPPFSIGLNVANRQSICPVPLQGYVLIPAYTGTANYAYVYQPSSVVIWNSGATPIINTGGGADWSNVSSPNKGNSFTLKATVVGGQNKWYVMSFIGVSFS
jgi:hypothetical protein